MTTRTRHPAARPRPKLQRNGDSPVPRTAIVAGAERLFCQSLMTTIEQRFTVLDTVTTFGAADRALERHQPHLSVLVVDPPFPDAPTLESCMGLVERFPMTCALLIFRERRPKDLIVACRQGARALFDMTITVEQLVNGMERLADGEVVMQPEILQDMMRTPVRPGDGLAGTPITAVQTRMLGLLAEGHTSKEIASTLNVSTASVNHQLERAAQRLGARHRTEAVARALRLGLIS